MQHRAESRFPTILNTADTQLRAMLHTPETTYFQSET
jgi:hypothetical protein